MIEERARALIAELEKELARLDAALAVRPSSAQEERVKTDIAVLFKRTESLVTDLSSVKSRIRALVDRFKELTAEPPPATLPAPAPPENPPLREDHLGASTFIEKGWSLIAQGDPAGAIQALTRALELAPGSVQAKSLLGWAQMLAEQHDEALATFSLVLAQEPSNALARVNVGFICLRKRIFGEAIEHLSRVIRLDNDRKATLYAHYYLGLVYLDRQMYADARAFLERAIVLGPNLIEAYYDLGRVQWFQGDETAARVTWKKGADANRFAPWSKRCHELLAAVDRGEPVPRSSSQG